MQLFKDDRSPYWYYRFEVGGVKYRKSTKRTNRSAAQRVMAREYDRVMNQSQFGELPEITLADALKKPQQKTEGKTAVSYDLCRRKWLGEGVFGDHWHLPPGRLFSSLGQAVLDDHIDNRRDEGLSAGSINIEIRFLKRAHNLCKTRYMVPVGLDFGQLKNKGKTRFLSNVEQEAVLVGLEAQKGSPAYDKARDLYVVLLDTGLALGDATGLLWDQVHWGRNLIIVPRRKTGVNSVIPISNRVEELLRRRGNQSMPFVEMTRGIRLLRLEIDKHCNRNTKNVEAMGKATIHSLRDTFASRMAAAGLSLHQIGKMLGHSSPTMTFKYAQLIAEDYQDTALEALNA